MSVDATMAVLYAQTGLAAPLANAAAVAPQASLAMSRVLAAEMARQQQQQIEKTEKAEAPTSRPTGAAAATRSSAAAAASGPSRTTPKTTNRAPLPRRWWAIC